MSCITTYTGKHFDPVTPDASLIDIKDVAHALSMTCRGNGHVTTFFSVASHCIICCREAMARGYSDRVALACLLHDASESYMSDVPRPFKHMLSDYIELENKLIDLVYTKYLGSLLTDEEKNLVKEIDDAMCYYDVMFLLREPQDEPKPKLMVELDYSFVPFDEVEKNYLELFELLTNRIEKNE